MTNPSRFLAFIVFSLPLFGMNSEAGQAGCFSQVHAQNQAKDADYFFDLKFDETAGGDSFSCDLRVRASDARKAIDAFRYGVLYDSETHIKSSLAFPIVARVFRSGKVTDVPEKVEIRNFEEWAAFKKARFSKLHLAQVACASLRNVQIVRSRTHGFTIGNGMIWFQRSTSSTRVRVTAINLTPADPEQVATQCGN